MQRLTVRHTTRYLYKQPVSFGTHRLLFRPRDSHDLRLIDAKIRLSPAANLCWLHDVFGNSVATATFQDMADELLIESEIVVDRYAHPVPHFPLSDYAKSLPFSYPVSERPDLGRLLERHYSDPERELDSFVKKLLSASGGSLDTLTLLTALTERIKAEFSYEIRHEPGIRTPAELIHIGSGTCRDFAVFMIEAVRVMGIAARFVSGYLYDPSIDAPQLDALQADSRSREGVVGAGATHAWVQVYLPGAGWVDYDPTNGTTGGQNLVPIAVAREPSQAIPVSGSFTGPADALREMIVDVEVRSLHLPEQSKIVQ